MFRGAQVWNRAHGEKYSVALAKKPLILTLQWGRGEKHYLVNQPKRSVVITESCSYLSFSVELSKFIVEHLWIATLVLDRVPEPVYVGWTPALFIQGENGKVVQFRRLEMLNFFFSTRKLYLDIQMQSSSNIIRLLLFVEASGFYFFSFGFFALLLFLCNWVYDLSGFWNTSS